MIKFLVMRVAPLIILSLCYMIYRIFHPTPLPTEMATVNYGSDDRQVVPVQEHTHSPIGKLIIPNEEPDPGRVSDPYTPCTATLVTIEGAQRRDVILTAGHCFMKYDSSKPIYFFPAYHESNPSGRNYGILVKQVLSRKQFPATNYPLEKDDFAVGVLDHALTCTGQKIVTIEDPANRPVGNGEEVAVSLIGYPIELSEGKRPYLSANCKAVSDNDDKNETYYKHSCDSSSGQSGSLLLNPAAPGSHGMTSNSMHIKPMGVNNNCGGQTDDLINATCYNRSIDAIYFYDVLQYALMEQNNAPQLPRSPPIHRLNISTSGPTTYAGAFQPAIANTHVQCR